MPRIARRDLNTCFYHAIVQGMKKEFIFNTPIQIEKYKEIIVEKLKDSNIIILAYCIMNNHAHFLIYSEKSEYLSKFMQKLNSTYSNYYNKTNNRVGYVFRNRFYSQGINDNKQLFNCLRYIHNNPVKAKIVDVPEKYEFSSYNSYINGTVSKKNIEILFESTHNYINLFKKIHNNVEIDNFQDYVEDVDYNRQLRKISNMNIGEIIMNKNELNETVKDLIENEKVPINKVCEIFKMSRYKIKKILENK